MRWLVYYWKVTVCFALADVYRELTGKEIHLHLYLKLRGERVAADIRGVAEYVCKETGMDYNRFQLFFQSVENPQTPTEELKRFFKLSEELLIDLHYLRLTILPKRLEKAAPQPPKQPTDEKQLRLLLETHITCERMVASPRWKEMFGQMNTEERRERYIRRAAQNIAAYHRTTDLEPIIKTLKETIKNTDDE